MTRYKLILEYDGTDLIGWQQNHQGPSVQSLLQDAIKSFCGADADVVAAGRTDAGGPWWRTSILMADMVRIPLCGH